MKKRMISLLLVVCMMIILLPAVALAAPPSYTLTLPGDLPEGVNSYTVKVNGITIGNGQSITIGESSNITLNCSLKNGYIFAGWHFWTESNDLNKTRLPAIKDYSASIIIGEDSFVTPIVIKANHNVKISEDGVLTWNEESAVNPVSIEAYTSKVIVHQRTDSGGSRLLITSDELTAGSNRKYTYDLKAALDSLEESQNTSLSGQYSISLQYCMYKTDGIGNTQGGVQGGVSNPIGYTYNGKLIKLDTPTNLRWDGFVAKWNPVKDAVSYTLYLEQNSSGVMSDMGSVNVSEPQFNLYDFWLTQTGRKYHFKVRALPAENSDTHIQSYPSDFSDDSATLHTILRYSATPEGKVFDGQPEGYAALTPEIFTIKNVSPYNNAPITNLRVSLTGKDSGSFILNTSGTASALEDKDHETTFTVVPKAGLTEGTYEATIEVNADLLSTMKKPISFTVLHTHTPEADDGDCTTAVICTSCGEIVTAAKESHSLSGWQHDDTNHWKKCTNAGCAYTEQSAAHTPGADDGDCTTPIICSVCGYITTAAKTHDFTGDYLYDEDSHWHECANIGCSATDVKKAHTWIAGTITKAATYFEDGAQVYDCICGATKNVVLPQLIDTDAPTGSISIGTHNWNSFLNTITFGLFFKETQTVSVTADDAGSGVDQTYYYLSDMGLSKEEAAALTGWTAFNGSFHIDPNHNYVVYIKMTDKVGNSSIINSDGVVLDNIVPQISGATDGGIYCAATSVTVSDDNLGVVTLNGEEVTLTDGKFTVNPKDGEQTIVATDKAGNSTTIEITVYDAHLWDEGRVTTPPTAAEEGVKTYTCEHCGANRTEPIAKLAPSMTEGEGNAYERGTNGTLIFRSNAAFADFISISMDGDTLSPDHYTLSDGSILVELKGKYLETLAVGIHVLGIHSVSGTATAEFTIEEKPTVTGPTELVLIEGYAATATSAYTVGGFPIPAVTQDTTHGGKIVWNDATKKLDIAAGLTAGSYSVKLTASVEPEITITSIPINRGFYAVMAGILNGDTGDTLAFTLTISPKPIPPTIAGPTTMTLAEGYGAVSTGMYMMSGTPEPIVTKTSGSDKISWNNTTKKLDIAPGLIAGTYPVELTVSNGAEPDTVLTFTLTVQGKGSLDDIPKLGDRWMGGWWLLGSLSVVGIILTLAACKFARQKRKYESQLSE